MKLQIWKVSNHSVLTFTSFLNEFFSHWGRLQSIAGFVLIWKEELAGFRVLWRNPLPCVASFIAPELQHRVYVKRKRLITQSETWLFRRQNSTWGRHPHRRKRGLFLWAAGITSVSAFRRDTFGGEDRPPPPKPTLPRLSDTFKMSSGSTVSFPPRLWTAPCSLFFHQVVSLLTSAHLKSDSPQLCVDELTALPDSKERGGEKSLESHYNFTVTGASPPCQRNSSPLKRPGRGFINQFLHEAPGMSPSIPLPLFFWPAETQCQGLV